MKSPWKLIGQIFSARRAPKTSQRLADDTKNAQDVQHADGQPAAPILTLLGTSEPEADDHRDPHFGEQSSHNALSSEPPEVETFLIDERDPSKETPGAIAARVPGKRDRRPRQFRSTQENASHPVRADAPFVEETPAYLVDEPLSFDAEVAHLDGEVRALRRQLSEKLTLQNAQLRKMLERFGKA